MDGSVSGVREGTQKTRCIFLEQDHSMIRTVFKINFKLKQTTKKNTVSKQILKIK